MKKWYTVLFALVLIGFGAAVYAAPPGEEAVSSDSNMGGQTLHHHPFWGRLDLSQEQKQQMRAVWNRYRNDVHDLRYDLMEKRVEARKLFTDPKADQAAILAKERELNGLRQKLMERTMQAKLEWRSILTPEQIAKLDSMPRRHGMGRCRGMM